MSDTQKPEALRLADNLADFAEIDFDEVFLPAAAELRRLQAENEALLAALRWIADRCPVHLMDEPLHAIHKEMAHDAGARARAAIYTAMKENP